MVSPSALAALGLVVAVAAIGCKPEIGDACKLSTDCSITGDRQCDPSQPDGYCLTFNCEPDTCPDEAMCIEFHPAERPGEERFSRRFCLKGCDKQSDCRRGYRCTYPSERDGRVADGDPKYAGVCMP
jgi:hypothetical protein